MQWMEDGGIQPSSKMYNDILCFSQKDSGTEIGVKLRERLGKCIMICYFIAIFYIINLSYVNESFICFSKWSRCNEIFH